MSSKIGWPLIELNPSNFLGKGLEQIYQQVEDVFIDLHDVWEAVIFFDEMATLASKRTHTIDVTARIIIVPHGYLFFRIKQPRWGNWIYQMRIGMTTYL